MTKTEAIFVRLLATLEEFAAQESLQLAAGEIAATRALQERAAPVVAQLVSLGGSAIPAAVHSRLVALVNRRVQNQEHMDRQLARMRDALGQTEAKLRRIAQVAPVYGCQARTRRLARAVA